MGDSKKKEHFAVGALLIAILLVFFHYALHPDRVLSPADRIFSTPFFAELAPPGFTEPANPLLFDQVYQFAPWRYFVWKSLREGTFPLWNPYSYCGTPLIATMLAAVFYPINLLLTLLPFHVTFVWSALLRLWIAGISTYLLMRRYGLTLIPSLIASISFMLCGFLIVWLGHPHTNVAVWLPALMLCGEVLVTAASTRTALQAIACLALLIGIQFTGGHIETSVDILFTLGVYYFIRWAQVIQPTSMPMHDKVRRLLVPTVPFLLGCALAAVQLLPFLEWLPHSAILDQRSATSFQFINPLVGKHLLSLPVLIFPNLFNNPTWGYSYWSFLLNWGNYNELVLYVGILTLIYAALAVWKPRAVDQPFVRAWVILAIVSFGRAFSLPVFDWFNQVPGMQLGAPARLRLITALSLCVLAGFGAQVFFERGREDAVRLRRTWLRLCGIVVLCGVVLMAASNIVLPLIKENVVAAGKRLVKAEYTQRYAQTGKSLEDYYRQVEQKGNGLVAAFAPTNVAMYAPALWAGLGFFVVGLSVRYCPHRRTMLEGSMLTLVILDLFTFGYRYNPSLPSEQFYPRTTVVSKLLEEKDLSRVIALKQDLIPDVQMLFPFSDVRGMDFPTRRYDQYLSLVSTRVPWVAHSAIFSSADSALLRVLNIKYIITADSTLLNIDEHIKRVEKVGNLYRGVVAHVQPRAFMVYDALSVHSDQEVRALLTQEPEKVFRRVVLSLDSPEMRFIELPQREEHPVNTVAMVAYEPHQSQWTVSTNQDGYLFVSESYYPGWTASLDGTLVPLYRANLAFRAIFIPAGQHEVIFAFEPMSVRIGLAVGALATLMITALFAWSWRIGKTNLTSRTQK